MSNANEVKQPLKYERLDAIIAEVTSKCEPQLADKYYAVAFPEEYEGIDKNLFDTPHGYWDTTEPLPNYHSDRFHRKIADTIATGTDIDIITLGLPNGNLDAAIRWGVHNALGRPGGGPISVRILCGSAYTWTLNTDNYVKSFYNQVLGWDPDVRRLARLKLYVASQEYGEGQSWNHGKAIIIDQKEIMFGGHNMWGDAYMGTNPIFDLSIALKGDLAPVATRFANELWAFVRKYNRHGTKTYCTSFAISNEGRPYTNSNVPELFTIHRKLPVDKGIKALYHVQPGLGLVDHKGPLNPIFVGMNYAFRTAKKEINLVQQDIGSSKVAAFSETGRPYNIRGGFSCIILREPGNTVGYHVFYFDVLKAIAEALKSAERPKLNIVVTNPGGSSYSNGLSYRSIFRALGFMLIKVFGVSTVETVAILRDKVCIRELAFQGSNQWRDGKNIGLHTKYWEVDGQVVSVGSFNLYPGVMYFSGSFGQSYLTEFSVLLAGKKIVDNLKNEYFDKVWKSSKKCEFNYEFLVGLPDYAPAVQDEEVPAISQ
ncbi:MAG TPA: hypothetical protein VHB48_00100 [Chitinophagaceae bacterium]|nr:hypothetical protein [Chitinophagaceae bacterium]